jgi:hypothetical protein
MHRISPFLACCLALAFLFPASGSTVQAAGAQTTCCVDRTGPRPDTKEPAPKRDKPDKPEKPDKCCVDRKEPSKPDKPEPHQHHSQ